MSEPLVKHHLIYSIAYHVFVLDRRSLIANCFRFASLMSFSFDVIHSLWRFALAFNFKLMKQSSNFLYSKILCPSYWFILIAFVLNSGIFSRFAYYKKLGTLCELLYYLLQWNEKSLVMKVQIIYNVAILHYLQLQLQWYSE